MSKSSDNTSTRKVISLYQAVDNNGVHVNLNDNNYSRCSQYTRMMYHKPFNLDIDEFLKGEGKETDDLDIIDEFDGSFDELIINRAQNYDFTSDDWSVTFCAPHTKNFSPVDNRIIITSHRTKAMDGYYHYRKTYNGVVLLGKRGGLEGFYVDSLVSIAEEHRGTGLGTEIIVVASLLHGGNPAGFKGPLQYTPSGLKAHKRAWEVYRRFPERFVLQIKELTG